MTARIVGPTGLQTLLLALSLVNLTTIEFAAANLNQTNSISHTTSSERLSSARNSSSVSSLKAKLYPNHRFDDEVLIKAHERNNTNDERIAEGSVLRPQLAVQIYTEPTAHQPEAKNDKGHHQSSRQTEGTMLIVPAGHSTGDGRDPSESSAYSDHKATHRHQRPSKMRLFHSSAGEILIDKLDPWRYITEQPGLSEDEPSFRSIGSVGSSSYTDSSPSADRPVGGPTINAIISVPAPSSPQQQRDNHREDERETSDSSSSEAQSGSGSMEFSMNLNGDEIIINPVRKNGRIVSVNTSNDLSEHSGSEAGGSSAGSVLGTKLHKPVSSDREFRKKYSRSVRKHDNIDLGSGSLQSASEIDPIEGDDSDSEADQGKWTRERNDGQHTGKSSRQTMESDEGDKSERRSPRTESPLEDDDQLSEDLTANSDRYPVNKPAYEEHSNKKTSVARQTPSRSSERAYTSNPKKQRSSKKVQQHSAQRDTQSSKRRTVYRGDDGRESDDRPLSGGKNADRGGTDIAPVVIKGEDVKKFEQLLDSLRSLSLESLNIAKSKLPVKDSRNLGRQTSGDNQAGPGDSDQDERTDDNDSNSSGGEHSQDRGSSWRAGGGGNSEFRASDQSRNSSPSTSRVSQEDVARNTECDRLRQQVLRANGNKEQRSSSTGHSRQSNNAEQTAISNNDSPEDLNDEGSSSYEQDDQGNDWHDPPSYPGMEASESASSLALQQNGHQKERPKSLFVRSTVVKSYNNNNANDNDTTNARHTNSFRSRERPTVGGEEQYPFNSLELQPLKVTEPEERLDPPMRSDHLSDNPLNNYIDYNRLDDRGVYRESANLRLAMTARDHLDRLRSIQRILEKAALRADKSDSLRTR